jgi:hypothetical protein
MLTFHSHTPVRFCDGLTRRDFLRVGSLCAGTVGLSLTDLPAARANGSSEVNCIVLFLVGGPSQLDTWDPKPAAPQDIRGPFRQVATKVPGLTLCETFPCIASMADRFAVVRSVHHEEAPIHETGQQMMQTGRLCRDAEEYPHYGAVLSHLRGQRSGGLPPFALVPGPIGNTGVGVSHGQGAGFLGNRHEPFGLTCDTIDLPPGLDPARLHNRYDLMNAIDEAQRAFDASGSQGNAGLQQLFSSSVRRAYDLTVEPAELRQRYGQNTFGQSCLLARRLVEHGVRLVTVNMFDTVFDNLSWECHADGGCLSTTLDDYRETICPMFDHAYSALLTDLDQRGMLSNTLVVAMGEFGRTPQLNPRGGRDHWPGVWSILFAGAGVRGGQVIGSSDKIGAEPRDRPVTPAEVAATVYQALGVDLATLLPGPDGRQVLVVGAAPIHELFC